MSNVQGSPVQGDTAHGGPVQGDTAQNNVQGDTGQGDNVQGDTEQGDTGQGNTGYGDTEQGDTGQGDNDIGVDDENPANLDEMFKDKPNMIKCIGCQQWSSAEELEVISTYNTRAGLQKQFCTSCYINGTRDAHLRKDVGAHTVSLSALCYGCKVILPVAHTLESSENVYSYCQKCTLDKKQLDLFKETPPPLCICCNKTANPQYSVCIDIDKDVRMIAKTACSLACNIFITKKTQELLGAKFTMLCSVCEIPLGQNGITSLRCSRCKQAYYCGALCQKKHWPVHRLQCRA